MAKVPETQALLDEALAPSKAPREAVTAFGEALLQFTESLYDQARVWKRQALAMSRVESVPDIRDRAGELLQTVGALEREIASLETQATKVLGIEAQYHRVINEITQHAETAGYKVQK